MRGEDPRLHGLYHSCGYNSAGMMLGGGCGEQLAKWIIQGRPDLHMFNYDIRRFLPEQTKDSDWINAKSHECYAKNYSIVFPHDEPLAGRDWRKGPFHERGAGLPVTDASQRSVYSFYPPQIGGSGAPGLPLSGHESREGNELLSEGCVFEERQGWERPGWYSPNGPAPVPTYDWYGAYGTPRNTDQTYEKLIKGDYTFGFTKNHNLVSCI
uniref:FAD dependent oxidoreductase central domain-containing protein n=1 Tax=Timema shepardi TaxID=629360 RepID=A0A7R9B7J7_TIMSH|nr:unnamed protein product [Timema shepardi]